MCTTLLNFSIIFVKFLHFFLNFPQILSRVLKLKKKSPKIFKNFKNIPNFISFLKLFLTIVRRSEHRDQAEGCIRLHVTAHRVSCRCKREFLIASPSSIFYVSRLVPIRLLHVRSTLFSFAKVIFAAGRGVCTVLSTVVRPFYRIIFSNVAKVLRATQILTLHVSPTSPIAALWA